MKSKIVHLPDSPAIAVPQSMLDLCNLRNEVDLEAHGGCLIVRNSAGARQGWDEAFAGLGQSDDKMLLNDLPPSRWDQEEWEW